VFINSDEERQITAYEKLECVTNTAETERIMLQ
jgi:hypothetical protein